MKYESDVKCRIDKGDIVVVWGYGNVGKRWIKIIDSEQFCKVKYIVDRTFNSDFSEGEVVYTVPEKILKAKDYNKVILAVEDASQRDEMRQFLVSGGIPSEIIIDGAFGDEYDFTVNGAKSVVNIYSLSRNMMGKKIVVYGNGRRALDYQYVFGNPDYFIRENNKHEDYNFEVPVVDLSELCFLKEKIFVVAACDNYWSAAEVLKDIGFEKGISWCYLHELGGVLDLPSDLDNITAIIPADGEEYFKKFCMYYGINKYEQIIRICNNTDEQLLDMSKYNNAVVFSSELNFNKLPLTNIDSSKVIAWTTNVILPSVVFQKTVCANVTRCGRCSTRITDYVEIGPKGTVYLCCPVYMKASLLGAVGNRSFKEIWLSKLARVIRLSIINRTYVACNITCSIAKHKYEFLDDEHVIQNDYKLSIPNYPSTISMNIDESCNLHCAFCRKELLFYHGETRECTDTIAKRFIDDVFNRPEVREIRLAGAGEVFASPTYKRILLNEGNKGKDLYLYTNGTLFSMDIFEKIENIYNKIRICVSVGAFNKYTYERLWRGGNYEKIVKNLETIGHLRKIGKITHYRIYYMCCKDTYEDIPQFTEFAENIGVDEICLMRLFPKADIVGKVYDEKSLFVNNELKQEYVSFFSQPLFDKSIFVGGNVIH